MKRFRWLLAGIFLLVGCVSSSRAVSTPTSLPSVVPTWTSTLPPQTDIPASPSVTPSPFPSPPPCDAASETCFETGHFLLEFPLPSSANRIPSLYTYGGTLNASREPHHGVDFENPEGTPVLAAADGRVIFAGSDRKESTFAPWANFYGNHVVLEHHLEGMTLPLYTLYAHLSSIDVKEGDYLHAGEKVGEVGSTGVAIGSHLHFEVRYGESAYTDTQNPLLWLKMPNPENGALIGRVEDSIGRPVHVMFTLQKGDALPLYLETYAREKYPVGSDANWQENFALVNLPPGMYRLSLVRDGKVYEREIKICAGCLSRILLRVEE